MNSHDRNAAGRKFVLSVTRGQLVIALDLAFELPCVVTVSGLSLSCENGCEASGDVRPGSVLAESTNTWLLCG